MSSIVKFYSFPLLPCHVWKFPLWKVKIIKRLCLTLALKWFWHKTLSRLEPHLTTLWFHSALNSATMSPRSHSRRALALHVAWNTARGLPLRAPGLASCSSDLSYPSLALLPASLITLVLHSITETHRGKGKDTLVLIYVSVNSHKRGPQWAADALTHSTSVSRRYSRPTMVFDFPVPGGPWIRQILATDGECFTMAYAVSMAFFWSSLKSFK